VRCDIDTCSLAQTLQSSCEGVATRWQLLCFKTVLVIGEQEAVLVISGLGGGGNWLAGWLVLGVAMWGPMGPMGRGGVWSEVTEALRDLAVNSVCCVS